MIQNKKQQKRCILLIFLILIISGIHLEKILHTVLSLIPAYQKESIELKYVEIKNSRGLSRRRKYKHNIELPALVAHAGGGIGGLQGTNSLEALNASYKKGFRFLELDFNWTADNHLILLHDFKKSINNLFSANSKIYSLGEFKKLKMINNLTQMTLSDLIGWLNSHRDAFIITDIKRNNMAGLKHISQKYPHIQGQIIPQIYRFTEYWPVEELGYNNPILTLYLKDYSDDILLRFIQHHPVSAVTMPIGRAMTGLPLKLKNLGIFVYAHAVNHKEVVDNLKANGVDGFYTDFLEP